MPSPRGQPVVTDWLMQDYKSLAIPSQLGQLWRVIPSPMDSNFLLFSRIIGSWIHLLTCLFVHQMFMEGLEGLLCFSPSNIRHYSRCQGHMMNKSQPCTFRRHSPIPTQVGMGRDRHYRGSRLSCFGIWLELWVLWGCFGGKLAEEIKGKVGQGLDPGLHRDFMRLTLGTSPGL